MPYADRSKPYVQSLQTVGTAQQSTNWPNIPSSEADQATEADDPLGAADPATGVAQQQGPGPGETTGTAPRLHVNSAAQTPTNPGKNAQPLVKSAIIVEGLDTSQKCRRNPNNHNKTEDNHVDSEEQSPEYSQSEYTTPYYMTSDQAKASIKCLKTTAKIHHMCNTDTEHIRPLWVPQSQGSQVHQTDCKVNTGAGCNLLPAHRVQQLFGQEWLEINLKYKLRHMVARQYTA